MVASIFQIWNFDSCKLMFLLQSTTSVCLLIKWLSILSHSSYPQTQLKFWYDGVCWFVLSLYCFITYYFLSHSVQHRSNDIFKHLLMHTINYVMYTNTCGGPHPIGRVSSWKPISKGSWGFQQIRLGPHKLDSSQSERGLLPKKKMGLRFHRVLLTPIINVGTHIVVVYTC